MTRLDASNERRAQRLSFGCRRRSPGRYASTGQDMRSSWRGHAVRLCPFSKYIYLLIARGQIDNKFARQRDACLRGHARFGPLRCVQDWSSTASYERRKWLVQVARNASYYTGRRLGTAHRWRQWRRSPMSRSGLLIGSDDGGGGLSVCVYLGRDGS